MYIQKDSATKYGRYGAIFKIKTGTKQCEYLFIYLFTGRDADVC